MLRRSPCAGESERSGSCGQTHDRASGARLKSQSGRLGWEHFVLGETVFPCMILPTTEILPCLLVETTRSTFKCPLKDYREGSCLISPRWLCDGKART